MQDPFYLFILLVSTSVKKITRHRRLLAETVQGIVYLTYTNHPDKDSPVCPLCS